MPRKTRMYIPGIPAHVVQRGHNQDACFFTEEDFHYYLQALEEGVRRYDAALHAYCLMTNHVHLLLTPGSTDSISRLMQHVGRQYVQYANRTYGRSGTLWEGRHKGSVVDAEHYLLSCYRYIELNPVSAGMVERPEQYPWSSFRYNALGELNELVTPHPVYESLSPDRVVRHEAYRALFRTGVSEQARQEIADCLAASQVLGTGRFREQVESALGRKVGQIKRGRPRQAPKLIS